MERLRRRADFLAAAAGGRVSVSAFVLQIRERGDAGPPRFGFTVSRKVGTAVERNRVRRRLKAMVRLMDPTCARAGHDYVIVGRRAALAVPFSRLGSDLQVALRRAADKRDRGGPGAERTHTTLEKGGAEIAAPQWGGQPRTDESLP